MSKRVEQIKTAFPDFPDENIIMGFQKSVVQVDITLDDGPHNILKSSARFPVLMRRPWNRELTGLLAVHNYEEFFQLLDQIKSAMIEDRVEPGDEVLVTNPWQCLHYRVAYTEIILPTDSEKLEIQYGNDMITLLLSASGHSAPHNILYKYSVSFV